MGTKFLRRIVIVAPADANEVRIAVPAETWLVRRVWVGCGEHPATVTWRTASAAFASYSKDVHATDWILQPGQSVDLEFQASQPLKPTVRQAYLLRMRGYYEIHDVRRKLPQSF